MNSRWPPFKAVLSGLELKTGLARYASLTRPCIPPLIDLLSARRLDNDRHEYRLLEFVELALGALYVCKPPDDVTS